MPKSKLNEVQRAERRAKALELRAAGATYQIIARNLDYSSRGHAHRDIQIALDEIVKKPAEELLGEELNRLEKLLSGIWGEARKGEDVSKTRAVLQILDMRAKYLGLYAPERVQAEIRLDDPEKIAESIIAISEGLKQ